MHLKLNQQYFKYTLLEGDIFFVEKKTPLGYVQTNTFSSILHKIHNNLQEMFSES